MCAAYITSHSCPLPPSYTSPGGQLPDSSIPKASCDNKNLLPSADNGGGGKLLSSTSDHHVTSADTITSSTTTTTSTSTEELLACRSVPEVKTSSRPGSENLKPSLVQLASESRFGPPASSAAAVAACHTSPPLLPPSIAISLDGEEGYVESQRRLHALQQQQPGSDGRSTVAATGGGVLVGRGCSSFVPPNKTVCHVW